VQHSKELTERRVAKFLIQTNPTPPKLRARLKIYKGDIPIRPIVNNINAPAYKLAKFLNKKLLDLIQLPNTYNVSNSVELAQQLTQIRGKKQYRMIAMDIKDLYVNIPIHEVIHITKITLQHTNTDKMIEQQITRCLDTILQQNFFIHNNTIYQPHKGVAMESPISGTIYEIFLQHFETHIIKHLMEIKSVIVYKRYVDDILVVYDQEKINLQQIKQTANSIHSTLSFKHELEDNGNIVFLDLTLHRNETNITIDLY
jgi:hypothetical protein